MIVYHVDKFNMLQTGDVLSTLASTFLRRNDDIRCINSFFDDKLQMFALQTLKEADCGDPAWAITEAVLEYVRALKFSKLPSRMAVLYASRTIEEARIWRSHILPVNPEAKIVQLYTGRKVYSANYALRDEVYAMISESLADDHGAVPWVKLLSLVLPAAEAYWKATAPSRRALCSHNMGSEELLVVPPVRVLHRIEPS